MPGGHLRGRQGRFGSPRPGSRPAFAARFEVERCRCRAEMSHGPKKGAARGRPGLPTPERYEDHYGARRGTFEDLHPKFTELDLYALG